MIDLDNQTNFKIDLENLEKIASTLSNKNIELLIVDNKTIKDINLEFRNKDEATDVLSFPMEFNFPNMPLGSIIISIDFVRNKAKEFGHSEFEEFSLLFIHGFLHLLGFDHEVDNGEHREKEEELISLFNLPSSLIVRNS
ncbi:Endoribonuclease YbeY [Aliarcobacter thereius]|uniref:Endoribonuclease YbeY n=2 Tax=Aliarcobacter thereius TaxID=544718 RepID=A0A1C0B5E4_9BACT|nr:rRNA maturation RNase YbeY [Aliarcobacter thereius]OCL86055.1 Endoribonuclease YbeY [Aliarcobacter thereius]OCL90535.1 Endoribonuclease YbeY [Aliarcobacter thereius]OCL95658.1 Endoribonuclease YbeY [Aliarcobacter thereius LMG 24486]OCL97940.1 Endoribonuclease YbeY [Aliarcobacter thereius]QBF16355.1 rRNA maturation RNase [Aliarcobacter thereius LMG 24486]